MKVVYICLLFVVFTFFGCETDSDSKWQSFYSTGKLINSGYNSWTYQHNFTNLSSDKVTLKYEIGKDEHGFAKENMYVIIPNHDFTINVTYHDFMESTASLSCSVRKNDGKDLAIEKTSGRVFFKDK